MKLLKLIVLAPFAIAAIVLAIPFLVVIYPTLMIADVFNLIEERRIEKKNATPVPCELADGGGI